MSTSEVPYPSQQQSAYQPANEDVQVLLSHMVTISASDLYLIVDSPPVFRVSGVGYPGGPVLDGNAVATMAYSLMTQEQREDFERTREMNFGVTLANRRRYRINAYWQQGNVSLVARLIHTNIQGLAALGMPAVLASVAMSRRGLVLLVGATGTGKSTTLAAIIDHRNSNETGHIITIEDPIEYIHKHKKCVISQREVGIDTVSFSAALRNALRQAPDVILIGEIRDLETMEAALSFAETGHLCLSTLHSNNANQAVERILNFFPEQRLAEIRLQLSMNLRAIISQRLIPARTGGRIAALEVLLDTPRIRELVKRGEIDVLKEAMEQSYDDGCRTFDASLFDLWQSGRITAEEALRQADSANNLRLRIERMSNTGGKSEAEEIPLQFAADPGSAAALEPAGAPGAPKPRMPGHQAR